MTVAEIRRLRPSLSMVVRICSASSRVGAKISACGCPFGSVAKPLDHGNHKGRCFARPGLRTADDVPTSECGRNGLLLNRALVK